jgi:apolipoprotein N-acyltransferase
LSNKGNKKPDTLQLCAALAASAVILTVIQPPFNLDFLAWLGLVPFILVSSPASNPRRLAAIAYLTSLVYWLGNLYWIGFVTKVGWIAFCLYIALYWPILALAIRYCKNRKIPLLIAVPVLFVGAEAWQGYLITGFSWRFLAHSQYQNIRLIQIADIFGAAGVSFIIAMVNVLIAELIVALAKKNILRPVNFLKAGIVTALLVASVAYGNRRIVESDKFTEPGPLVAAVQSNVPLEVKVSGQARETIFTDLLRDSIACARAGSELIVWPETMVQSILDEQFLLLCDDSHPARVFDKTLGEHSKETAYVLVGAYGAGIEVKQDKIITTDNYNSAFLYRPDGQQDKKRYDKTHLVPFGEFVPFRKTIPFFYKQLMKMTPYDYDYTLTAGTQYTIFEMEELSGQQPHAEKPQLRESSKNYKFGVMICYEDTVPAIAGNFTLNQPGLRHFRKDRSQKQVDWLLNISNDGWFVKLQNQKVLPSTELQQHMAICVFRAVENRLAILRSVNTGISCLIDSLGRIQDDFITGTLPLRAAERQCISGWFVDRITLDKRITFFSKYGQWLDFFCAVCFFMFIIIRVSKIIVKDSSLEEHIEK